MKNHVNLSSKTMDSGIECTRLHDGVSNNSYRTCLQPWYLIVFFVVILSTWSSSQASVLFTTYNTGVDDSGSKLSLGAIDTHWSIVSGPGVTVPENAFVLTEQHPLGSYTTAPDALWISRSANGSANTGLPLTYQMTFDLTLFDPSTATLSGIWGVDDYGSILLNGITPEGIGVFDLVGTNDQHFNASHAFTITGGFVAGINTLQVQVVDTGFPSGLSVSSLVGLADIAIVPTPSPDRLIIVGVVMLLLRNNYMSTGTSSAP